MELGTFPSGFPSHIICSVILGLLAYGQRGRLRGQGQEMNILGILGLVGSLLGLLHALLGTGALGTLQGGSYKVPSLESLERLVGRSSKSHIETTAPRAKSHTPFTQREQRSTGKGKASNARGETQIPATLPATLSNSNRLRVAESSDTESCAKCKHKKAKPGGNKGQPK